MDSAAKIVSIDPPYAVAGGEIVIDCTGFVTLEPSRCAVLIDEVPAHNARCQRQEVTAIMPVDILGRGQSKKCFVHQRGGLQCVSVSLAPKIAGSQDAQLRKYSFEQTVLSLDVAASPTMQKLGYFG